MIDDEKILILLACGLEKKGPDRELDQVYERKMICKKIRKNERI